jgi:type IV secretory pathway VirJ component
MKNARALLTSVALLATAVLIFPNVSANQTDTFKVPTFGQVVVYRPDKPNEVVLFISGDGGWNKGVVSMAERLRDLGALVRGHRHQDVQRVNARLETLRISCGRARATIP